MTTASSFTRFDCPMVPVVKCAVAGCVLPAEKGGECHSHSQRVRDSYAFGYFGFRRDGGCPVTAVNKKKGRGVE